MDMFMKLFHRGKYYTKEDVDEQYRQLSQVDFSADNLPWWERKWNAIKCCFGGS